MIHGHRVAGMRRELLRWVIQRRHVLFIVAYSFLGALVFSAPLLLNLRAEGIWDWPEAVATYESVRHTVFLYGQFPLWNPYICGGSPALANPQTYFLSVPGLFALIFDPVVGPKLAIVVMLTIGGTGLLLLLRYLRVHPIASLAAVPLFFMSGFLTTHLAAGQFLWLTTTMLPWIFYGYVRSKKNMWWVVLGAAALAYIGLAGRSYLIAYSAMGLMSMAVFEEIAWKQRGRAIARAMFILGLAFAFAAWKFIPDLFFLSQAGASLEDAAVLPVGLLPHMLLDRNVYPLETAEYIKGVYWMELAMYVGVIPLLLLSTAIVNRRILGKMAPWILMAIVFIYYALTPVQENIFEFFPIIGELRNTHRSLVMVLLVGSLLVPQGLQAITTYILPKSGTLRTWVYSFVTVFLILDMAIMSVPVFLKAYEKMPDDSVKTLIPLIHPEFSQGIGVNPYRTVKTNRGTVEFCPAILQAWYGERAVQWRTHEDYRGEVFLEGRGNAEITSFSPNKLHIAVDLAEDTTVVVNQNWEQSWNATVGTLRPSSDGRIAIDLPAGEGEVELSYWPKGLTIGLWVTGSVFALLLGLAAWTLRKKRV